MNRVFSKSILFSLLLLITSLQTQTQQVLPLREQAKVIDEILDERLNLLLPRLMEKTGIDMWVMITREYNEDPIVRTFLPSLANPADILTVVVVLPTPPL